MAEYTSAFGDTGKSAHGEGLREDASSSAPARPLHGTPMAALVQRQVDAAGFSRYLGFVPAQIR